MTIERFTTEQFEEALSQIHQGWEFLGINKGEREYAVPVTANSRILVRSSIDASGVAADTGEDSIRLYIQVLTPDKLPVDRMVWKAAGKKLDAYTTRVPGWDKRLDAKIRQLWERAVKVQSVVTKCSGCSDQPFVGFVKSGKNEGRPYANHYKSCNHFQWLDTPMKNGDVVVFEQPTEQETLPAEVPAKVEPVEGKEPKSAVRIDAETDDGFDMASLKASLKSKPAKQAKMTYDRQPNDSQVAVIEADPNTDIRLMAPPGSGKTFVIEHRYQFLVESGINPKNILVVTYSKKMADEMLARISATAGAVQADQISTIHAFCYRLLTRWDPSNKFYGWSVPKDWEVKKLIDELVEKIWQFETDDEKPGYKEVLTWIANSKFHGHTVESSRQYFIEQLGAKFGDWLYQIRKQFDAAMANQKLMGFDDMLFYTEQLLINDPNFRTRWQKQFTQVIVDEAQDTNYQAMRILITLSLEPGHNSVYETWRE